MVQTFSLYALVGGDYQSPARSTKRPNFSITNVLLKLYQSAKKCAGLPGKYNPAVDNISEIL